MTCSVKPREAYYITEVYDNSTRGSTKTYFYWHLDADEVNKFTKSVMFTKDGKRLCISAKDACPVYTRYRRSLPAALLALQDDLDIKNGLTNGKKLWAKPGISPDRQRRYWEDDD